KETDRSREYEIGHVSLERLPDVVTHLQNETDLTRKTIIDILIKSNTLDRFKLNPQIYMQGAGNIINSVKERFIVDGIKYSKLGGENYYSQKLFETEEISGYLNDNLIPSDRGIFDHVVYDSEIEREFVNDL